MTNDRTFVVGDVHGHRDALAAALRDRGLVDHRDDWSGGRAQLWFLGDFVDRGPEGIEAIDLARKLQRQAAATGGLVDSVLGNHEILLLGTKRFGNAPIAEEIGPRNFASIWEINGGQRADLENLTEEHIEWLVSRPVVAHTVDHLLLHADTLEYLEWGDTAEEINSTVRGILKSDDLEQWWDIWRRMTSRYALRGPQGCAAAQLLLDQLGGRQVVHGHSVISEQLNICPWEIEEPLLYAGGKALGVDAGVFAGGPCLVVPLPWGS